MVREELSKSDVLQRNETYTASEMMRLSQNSHFESEYENHVGRGFSRDMLVEKKRQAQNVHAVQHLLHVAAEAATHILLC